METSAQREILGSSDPSSPSAGADVRIRTPSSGALGLFTAAMIIVIVGQVINIVPFLRDVPLVRIIGGVALVLLVVRYSTFTVDLRDSAIARRILWLCGLAALSTLYSAWPGKSASILTGTVAVWLVMLLLVFKTSSADGAVDRYVRALSWSAVALVVGGLWQGAGDRLSFYSSYDPNDLAFVLIVLLPIVLVRWRTSRGLAWAFWLAVALASVWIALLTQSRGGLLGLLATVLFLVTLGFWRRQVDRRSRLGQLIVGAIVVAAVAVPIYLALPESAKERFGTLQNISEDYNVTSDRDGRLNVWKRGLQIVADRPWGVGVGAYPVVEMEYGGRWKTAHNSLLQLSVELGIVAFLVYVAMFIRAWRVLGAMVQYDPGADPLERAAWDRWAMTCQHLRASLIAILATGFFLSQAYAYVSLVVFAVVAAIEARFAAQLGIARIAKRPPEGGLPAEAQPPPGGGS
jgi:O-antigen ligase